ncbi:molybdenum cofactor guanylyltransferase [Methanococcus aeolicus]|uniref:molybdenum cofactor guanylyltransferase n=1 Tax=Methanococcus aeolicus TaxID=42879 RepID=UPI0021C9B757|nr:molybdenum cofactor guanylyltransferase [Methanococcus aeolicus]UXM85050.1 molybdenum cofactor guanylyltransferase [Methanococcus aeolicus]
MINKRISAIILSGGKATRMGGEKPFRKVNNNYLIEKVADVLHNMELPFVVVFKHICNSENSVNTLNKCDIDNQIHIFKKYNQTITFDILYNKGPLIGILSGMNLIEGGWVLILPCDTPLISENSIKNIINKIPLAESNNCNCIIPKHENGYIEPLFSIYHKSTIKTLEKIIRSSSGDRHPAIRQYINELNPLFVDVNEIDETHKSFVNVNTHNDLNKL